MEIFQKIKISLLQPKFFLSLLLFLFVISFFGISVFKNIQYPLFWNDEADTAAFGQRILEIGYPKVHGEKNILDLTPHPDRTLGIKECCDAFITMPWLQYYLAAGTELFLKNISDFYQKTAVLRIIFSIVGFLGLGFMAFSVLRFFENKTQKLFFISIFLGLSAISVSLVLHLREVRYYSLAIFVGGLAFWIFEKWQIEKKTSFWFYCFSSLLALFLMLNTYFPLYFIFIASFFSYSFLDFLFCFRRKQLPFLDWKDLIKKIISSPEFTFFLRSISPILISLLFSIPFIAFFEVFRVGNEVAKTLPLHYFSNISRIFGFFVRWEFLFLAIALEIVVLTLYFSRKQFLKEKIRKTFFFSRFLVLFFLIYVLVISRIPFLFERYFILLIPTLNLIIVLDFFLVSKLSSSRKLIYTLFLFFVINGVNHEKQIKERWIEINNRYLGPLDFSIPYLAEKYPDTKDLIIATNYEEAAYMYYLDAQVIIGYTGNNLEKDSRMVPDVVILRKGRDNNVDILQSFLQKNSYEKKSFPVFDSQVNNIPELDCLLFHLYRTKWASSEEEKLEIYLKR